MRGQQESAAREAGEWLVGGRARVRLLWRGLSEAPLCWVSGASGTVRSKSSGL